MNKIKTSHKVLFMTIAGVVVTVSLAIGIVIIGGKQIDTLKEVYRLKIRPLDDMRKIQLLFREIEYRMLGVLSDKMTTPGSRAHLEQSMKTIEGLWDNTKEKLDIDALSGEKKRFKQGLREFNKLSVELLDAYFDWDVERVEKIYDRWLDLQPLILKSIDIMAEVQGESVVNYYIKSQQVISRVNKIVITMIVVVVLAAIISGYCIIKGEENRELVAIYAKAVNELKKKEEET